MARKTEADVEEASLASRAKLWRIETGRVAVKVGDVRGLCWLYGADGWADPLTALAAACNRQEYWEDHQCLDGRPRLYAGLESAADEIRIYEPSMIPDLLQTPEYRRRVRVATNPDESDDVRRDWIELHVERQEAILDRTSPPRLTVALEADVLRRPVGDSRVMAEQRSHLRQLNRRDYIDIRVVPQDVGAHPAMRVGAFTILDFHHEDDPAVVHVESLTGARYTERAYEIGEYRRTFRQLYEKTVEPRPNLL